MRSGFLNTLGRTEPICGRWFGEIISAKILPPKAGRVHSTRPSSVSTVRIVQSATTPFCMRPDMRGAKSRPLLVAPIKRIFGLWSSKKSVNTFV